MAGERIQHEATGPQNYPIFAHGISTFTLKRKSIKGDKG